MRRFITDERMARFEEVLENRTRRIIPVLEDTAKEQNASAVIRTMDALGVHEVHMVENDWKVKLNAMISKGSDKWLDLRKSHDPTATLCGLKERGYTIVSTCPHEDDVPLMELTTEKPLAIVFGNEWDGISDAVRAETDVFMRIPMYGFVESYNLSAAAAMVFSHLRWDMERRGTMEHLTETEKLLAKLRWTIRSSRSGAKVYKQWLSKHGMPDLSGILK